MPARSAVTQDRAAFAEDTQSGYGEEVCGFWRAIWADEHCSAEERAEFERRLTAYAARLAVIVGNCAEDMLEREYVRAFLGAGLPAMSNKHSRVMKLTREARRNGEGWARTPEEVEEMVAAMTVAEVA